MKSALLAATVLAAVFAQPSFAAAPAAAPGAAAAPAAGAFDPRALEGVWMQTEQVRIRYDLSPEYAGILKARQDLEAAGKAPQADPCIPGPIVRMMTLGVAPIEIARVNNQTLVVTKDNGSIYRVRLNRPHLPPEDLTQGLYGDAVGHWEGDTLVIDHIGLGGSATIEGRTPHSDQMHVVQRWRLISADLLENQMLIEDPKAFTAPVKVTVTYKREPTWEMGEFFCTNERMSVAADGTAIIQPSTAAPE